MSGINSSVVPEHWIQKRIRRFRQRQRRHPQAARVLAEGDSWFTYPVQKWEGASLVEVMNEHPAVNIVSIANPTAELDDLVGPGNRDWDFATYDEWLDGESYDCVLFSGGGNDVIGAELVQFVRDKDAALYGKQHIVDQAFGRALDVMRGRLVYLRAYLDQLLPKRPLIIHGYDYAIPSGKKTRLLGGLFSVGGWLRAVLERKKFKDLEEQAEIVNELIDRFNEMQKALAKEQAGIVHVDLRGTLKAEDWADEIHPAKSGQKKIARKLIQAIVGKRAAS